MEHLPNIVACTTPHNLQSYDTAGDYGDEGRTWFISVSRLPDWRYEACVMIHELVEMFLTRHHGVRWTDIDDFDIIGAGKNHPDPGSLTEAPYHNEHMLAEQLEKKFAKMIGVDWDEYNKALDALEWKQ